MPKKNIAEVVKEIAEPVARELGYSVWSVEFGKTGADYTLEITIDTDKAEGISIDDCQRFSDRINPALDEADPVEDAYILQVSSPGIERELKEPQHYRKMIGETVLVKLYKAIDGKKSFQGTLEGIDDDDNVTITTTEGTQTFPRKSIAKCNIVFNWAGNPRG